MYGRRTDDENGTPQYNTGNGKIIPTTTDPLHFATNASLITFPAPVSHPHMALEHAIEGGFEVLVPDLVSDTETAFALRNGDESHRVILG